MLVGGRVRGSLVPRARADVVSPSPQPSPKRRGRFRSFCCRFSSGRLGISPASAILDCRAWPWLWTSPSATSLLFDSRLSLLRGWWSVSPAGVGIHPGSESGTCFHSNRSCRQAPAHQGMKMRPGRWKCLGVMGATPPLWIPAPYRGTGHASDRRNGEAGAGGIQAYFEAA